MNTQVVPTATPEQFEAAVALAVDHLQRGDIVALPTETVYGLAADALNVDAALKIFEAKERPRFDPLIVHIPNREWLDRLTAIPSEDDELVQALARGFWPGPLTLVLPRRDIVPDVVTAGLETVAVRISAHPVFAGVLERFGGPLAAPSANRFGRISPTAAQHVFEELGGRVPLIVDAGPTAHGLESTIIAVRHRRIEVLRSGPITAEQLGTFGEVTEPQRKMIEAPGQLASHYAPRTRLILLENADSFDGDRSRAGLLAWRALPPGEAFAAARILSASGDLREAAANLFRQMRELDGAAAEIIVVEKVPENGLGAAIMDRLLRATT